MMVRLMMILGQGHLQANTALSANPNDPMVSADGLYRWDGVAWRAIENAIPPAAPRSPDGQFWWDGQQWRQIATAGPAATPVPDPASHLPPPHASPNQEEPGV
jgi:hypothetical protein